jgi:uncharacterized protein
MKPAISVKEYLAALAENRLLGVKCQSCGFVTAPPRLACRRCGGYESVVVELSGRGRIATFTSVHVPTESRRGQTPYLVVLVELEEGPWITGNLLGADAASATLDLIGRKVVMLKIPAENQPPEGPVPQFGLVE